VAGGELDAAQVDAGVEHGRDKRVTLMSGLPQLVGIPELDCYRFR